MELTNHAVEPINHGMESTNQAQCQLWSQLIMLLSQFIMVDASFGVELILLDTIYIIIQALVLSISSEMGLSCNSIIRGASRENTTWMLGCLRSLILSPTVMY